MKYLISSRRMCRSRGSNLIEFSICSFLLLTLLFSVIEFGRMILIYTTVANAARAGVRYAIVHGQHRSGTGKDGPSGWTDDPPQVLTVVQNFASAGALNPGLLTVHVTYPDNNNDITNRVVVSVSYPYDPLNRLFSSFLAINLTSTSRGTITF